MYTIGVVKKGKAMNMKKYKYELLNIYSGKWFTLKTNVFYEKHTLLKGEYECKRCILTSDGYPLYSSKY